ncbi:hypothetical protein [Kitasatospora purpeofusca]
MTGPLVREALAGTPARHRAGTAVGALCETGTAAEPAVPATEEQAP